MNKKQHQKNQWAPHPKWCGLNALGFWDARKWNEHSTNIRTKVRGFHFRHNKCHLSKKAQLKIQEMAFVLLALALLAAIAGIFFIRLQSGNIAQAGEEAQQKTAISLLDKIASITELNCREGRICIDEDKALIASSNPSKVKNLFQGIKRAEIRRIYPQGDSLIIYASGKGNQSYSTFINLCRQDAAGLNCSIAQLELWI